MVQNASKSLFSFVRRNLTTSSTCFTLSSFREPTLACSTSLRKPIASLWRSGRKVWIIMPVLQSLWHWRMARFRLSSMSKKYRVYLDRCLLIGRGYMSGSQLSKILYKINPTLALTLILNNLYRIQYRNLWCCFILLCWAGCRSYDHFVIDIHSRRGGYQPLPPEWIDQRGGERGGYRSTPEKENGALYSSRSALRWSAFVVFHSSSGRRWFNAVSEQG